MMKISFLISFFFLLLYKIEKHPIITYIKYICNNLITNRNVEKIYYNNGNMFVINAKIQILYVKEKILLNILT